jgi:hypothetical protein
MVSRARLGSLGLVESNNIAIGAVTSNSLANSSVTTAKIADNSVTSSKIASTVTSSSIAEGLNLYFSNDRARAAFTAGSGVIITDGTISLSTNANTIIALVSGIFENQSFTGDGTNTTFIMNRTVSGPANIFVHVNGLVAAPNVDYTVSGNVLTFTSNSISNSYIDVRYFRLV